MDKEKRSSKKYCRIEKRRNSFQQVGAVDIVMDVEIGNENLDTVLNNHELKILGHSTPVLRKSDVSAHNIEDSPELDYNCSPVTCTQDRGIDVAWDWQNTNLKSSNGRSKVQSRIETPKRTTQLQKKRNSNSPLLNKPVKRKLAKVERMESIGKFAAELMALTEKMSHIQKVDDILLENKVIFESSKTDDQLNVKSTVKDDDKKNRRDMSDTEENVGHVPDSNVNCSFADLFDDAADDFMVRCSQEVEARLLGVNEKSDSTNSSYKSDNNCQPTSTISDKYNQCISRKNSSDDNIQYISSNAENSFCKEIIESPAIKEPKVPHEVTQIKSSGLPKDKLLRYKLSTKIEVMVEPINNNNINSSGSKQVLSKDMFEPFDFPDDSFDDCLATCVDDDKLLSKLNKQANNSSKENNTTNIYEHCYTPHDTSNDKKFFKRKSLSDSCFAHNNRYTNRNKLSDTSQECEKAIAGFEDTEALETFALESRNSSTMKCTAKHVSETSTPIASGFVRKGGGQLGIRHNSDTSFNNIAKDVRSSSQPQQCTPAEIEKKHRDAKMRLEAKRSLLLNQNGVNPLSKNPPRKPVKR